MKLLVTNSYIEKIKSDAVEEYKKTLTAYENVDRVRENCLVLFDFDIPHMDIFSIERIGMNTNDERTIIGYFNTKEDAEKKDSKEWTLFISRNQHNKLIEEYANHTKKKRTSKQVLNG